MSDNVIVTATLFDEDNLNRLNALGWHHTSNGLVSCEDYANGLWYGGCKALEQEIWIGAFSMLNVSELVSAMQQINWEDPEYVMLYVCASGECRFTLIDWRNT